MMINPYLSFKGDCEAAFTLYAQRFGGQVGTLFRYAGSPMADQAPAEWGDKVMHGSVTIGAQEFLGADVAPDRYEAPKGFALSVQISNSAEAERIFRGTGEGRAGGDAARKDVLGRAVRPARRSLWSAVADQLRGGGVTRRG